MNKDRMRHLMHAGCTVLYLLGIASAFLSPWLSVAICVAVALMWVVPDQRIERMLAGEGS